MHYRLLRASGYNISVLSQCILSLCLQQVVKISKTITIYNNNKNSKTLQFIAIIIQNITIYSNNNFQKHYNL
jgi:hypothetical protein